MSKNYGLIVHPEDFDYFLNEATSEEAGELIKNMIRAFQGLELKTFDERFMKMACDKICGRTMREREVSVSRSHAGAMGGAPLGNDNASKKQAKNKQKTSKAQATNNPNNTNITNITNKPIKNIYGTAKNVLLTDEEYQKIVSRGLTDLIEELSLYMASKNKTYADHYMTVLAWGRRRDKETKIIRPNQFTQGVQQRDIDFDELEKKLVRN